MQSILIVSPDPENARMLSLAFELRGWQPHTMASLAELSKGENANVMIVDVVENWSKFKNSGEWKTITRTVESGCRTIVILPRGTSEKNAGKSAGATPIFLRRPYELIHLLNLADSTFPQN